MIIKNLAFFSKSWITFTLLICLFTLPIMATSNIHKRVQVFKTACNTYIYTHEDGKSALLIDPGSKSKKLMEYVKEKGLEIVGILNTHGHGDHIDANAYYAKLNKTKVYAYPGDELGYRGKYKINKPTVWLDPKEETLVIGKIKIKVLHTPGHSKGSVGFLIEDILFSGDTLFHKSIGRTWGKNKEEKMQQELDGIRKKFFTLPKKTLVFPGHGSSTTIQYEIDNNPFL